MPFPAGEIIQQAADHTLAFANVLTHISERAAEWAEEYIEDHTPNFDFKTFRNVAYEKACQLYDGEDGCVFEDDDDTCDPTEYEAEVMITTYVITAIQIVQHNTVITTNK